MANVRDVLTKFNFKVDHEKLDRLEGQLEGIKRRLEFLGAVEITRGLFELAEKFSAIGENLIRASEATGITVEEIQKLQFAAQQAGVSGEEMSHSLTILSRQLYAARNGSQEAQLAFGQIGLTPDQVNGFKNSRDALLAISDRLRLIDDPIKRAALSQQVLGRGSQRLAGLLSKGSVAIKEQGEEAQRLGIVLSGSQVKSLEKVEHAFNRLWGVMKAFGATIAAKVAPVIEYLINDFLKFFGANKALIDLNLEEWWLKFAYALGFVYGVLKGLTIQVLDFAKAWDLDKSLLLLVTRLASVATAFAFLGPVNIALGLLGVFLHDIWAGLTGRPTWLPYFEKWLGIYEQIEAITDYLADRFLAMTQSVSGIVSGLLAILGGPGAWAAFAADLVTGFGGTSPGQAVGGGVGQAVGGAISINAPMTFTVPPGTKAEDVGAAVKDAISGHLDRVFRETQRSLTPAVAR